MLYKSCYEKLSFSYFNTTQFCHNEVDKHLVIFGHSNFDAVLKALLMLFNKNVNVGVMPCTLNNLIQNAILYRIPWHLW